MAILINLLYALVVQFGPSQQGIGNEAFSEYTVKVTFLFNLALFIQWPESTLNGSDYFEVAVLGDDPFGPLLEEVFRGETVQGKPVRIRRQSSSVGLGLCHLVFIGKSEKTHLNQTLKAIGPGILTVSDLPQFCKLGGMVGFVVEQNRVKLEINPVALESKQLKANANLLNLARLVASNQEE